jgi:hypothetical protein
MTRAVSSPDLPEARNLTSRTCVQTQRRGVSLLISPVSRVVCKMFTCAQHHN